MPNYQDLLSNLLAVIHADGGHYEAEHGTVKAVTDAIEKVFEMKAHAQQARAGGRAASSAVQSNQSRAARRR
jgi:hypothetical protein